MDSVTVVTGPAGSWVWCEDFSATTRTATEALDLAVGAAGPDSTVITTRVVGLTSIHHVVAP